MTAPTFTLGDRLRRARREAGLDRAELADALGVTRTAVGQWENDIHAPKNLLDTAHRIAEVTGVDVDWTF